MTTTRYRSEYLLILDGNPDVVVDGIVDVTDGAVAWSGPASDAPDHDGPSRRIGGLLMPGFVNTHAHSPMVLLRGAGEGLPVGRWLEEVMWPREGRLTPEDVRWGMGLGAAELLGGGITTSHEMYFFSDEVATAAAAAGIRCVVTPPILVGADLSRFGTWEQQLAGITELAGRVADDPLVTVGIGPHSAYALPEETLEAVVDAARRHELHVHIHVAEAEQEGDALMDRHGMTVPALLDSLGMLDGPVVAAHCVWLTQEDVELFADRRVGVAHCPSSNGKHASGIAPVAVMREAGLPVGIATDGPSSHDRLDPFEEMRAAIRYARLRAGDAAAMAPGDALVMATREGAAVLGRDDLGTLTAGSRADMVHVDTSAFVPMVEPADLVTHLVYSGSPALVRDVWVDGEPVVTDGSPTFVDVAAARHEVTLRARRLAR